MASRSALPLLSEDLVPSISENAKPPFTERAPTVLALLVAVVSVDVDIGSIDMKTLH